MLKSKTNARKQEDKKGGDEYEDETEEVGGRTGAETGFETQRIVEFQYICHSSRTNLCDLKPLVDTANCTYKGERELPLQ